MNSSHTVSIWVALTGWDTERLDQFMSSRYDENGDFSGSDFSLSIGANYIDDDTIEADITSSTLDIKTLLAGFTHDVEIIASCTKQSKSTLADPVDTAILVYDLQAGPLKEFEYDGIEFSFIGEINF